MCCVTHLILIIHILAGVRTGRQIHSAGLPTNISYQNDPAPFYEQDPPLSHKNGLPSNQHNDPTPNYRNRPPTNLQDGPPSNSSYLRSMTVAVTQHEVVTAPPTRYYNPNYGYKEYWPGGQWVLYTTKIGHGRMTTTKSMPTICGMECPASFHNVGKVCGRWSTDTTTGADSCPYSWANPTEQMQQICHNWYPDDYTAGYHTYPSYCAFLNAECTAVKNYRNQTVLVFVHGGACKEQSTYFLAMGGDRYGKKSETSMEHRIKDQIKKMNNRFKKWDRTPWSVTK